MLNGPAPLMLLACMVDVRRDDALLIAARSQNVLGLCMWGAEGR